MDPWESLEIYHRSWRMNDAPELSDVYVPGEGESETPRVLIIGEAPGAEEQARQRPFVGPSGRVLRQLMTSAGVSTGYTPEFGKANAWLTNVVKFRPPRNRTPTPREVQGCRSMLRMEWQLIGRPTIIVPVGRIALEAVTGKAVSILKHSGWLHEQTSKRTGLLMQTWPMLHPAYALRNKAMQPLVEKDWLKFGAWLRDSGIT